MEIGNKIDPINLFVDSSLNERNSIKSSLSIFFGFNRCISIVLDQNSQKFLALSDIKSSNIIDVVKKTDFLQFNYKKIEVVLQNTNVCLIPTSVFNEKDLDSYVEFSHYKLKKQISYYDFLDNTDSVSVFFENGECISELKKLYPNISLKHTSSSFIDAMLLKSKKSKEEFVYTHLHDSFFEIIVIKNNKLLLYNFFEYKTAEDFVYFVLFTCEQLKLDLEKLNFFFSGNIKKDTNMYKLIYTYVRNVFFLMPPDIFTYSYPLTEEPRHTYSKFFYHFTCV